MPKTYPEALPHDEIEEVFDNIFHVRGSVVLPNGLPVSRNMIIVREGRDLTLINTVRLNAEGLGNLDALGEVKQVVRIGAFHGMDDPFYVDRYNAEMWAPAGIEHNLGLETGSLLTPGGPSPFTRGSYFHFETAQAPEGLILIEQDGGIIVSCDAMQNWVEVDHFFNSESTTKMRAWGFIRPAAVGVGWYNNAQPQAADFERINQLNYRHLLTAHGIPLKDHAKEAFAKSFATLIGS